MTPKSESESHDILTDTDTCPPLPQGSCFTYIEADDKVISSTVPDTYLLVNIGSGVSFFQVTDGKSERVSGSSFGGSALCGLLTLLTRAKTFEEMLDLAGKGNNANVDKLIGDIYGVDYNLIGMKMTAVASTFCKAFSIPYQADATDGESFSDADICHSLVFAVFNNIGQLATLHSRIHDTPSIYFTGPYVVENHLIIKTLSIAVRYYSGGKKKAFIHKFD